MADEQVKTTEAKTPTPVAKTVDKVGDAICRGIEKFEVEHLRNSSFSQDTAAWNHFRAGLPVLIEAIKSELEA